MSEEQKTKQTSQAAPSPAKDKQVEKPAAKPAAKTNAPLMAVILIRGLVNVRQPIKDTLRMIRLQKKHSCVIMEKSPNHLGMLNKVKDYVTYGEIDNETLKLLAAKRTKHNASSKSFKLFTLNSPKGGFERKGIKKPFSKGGVLGYRGSKINALLKKMI